MTHKPYELTTSEVDPTDIESALPGHFGRQEAVTTLAFGGGILLFLASLVTFGAVMGLRAYDMSRTAEATAELAKISKLSIEAYERGRAEPLVGPRLCKSAPHPVPEKFSSVQNIKYTSRVEDWREGAPDEGFRCLGFEIEGMQYYQYDFASTGSRGKFTAWARGDLDGNGVTAELAQYGEVDPTTQTVVLAKSLHKVRPGE
jgi:hypothetical protein